ncbi:S-layer family protein, partial [Bradyrhizobium diazoefficiens]
MAIAWSPASKTGIEGNSIALGTISGYGTSLIVSGIPVGATLTDGHGHSFTASVGKTSVAVLGWTLTSLSISTINDLNFVLTATGSTGSTTETVIVNPLAPTVTPVAVTGVEGQPIGLNLGVTVGGLTGDSNSLASLVIGAIPVGATLSDGTHSFTATSGSTSVDVSSWSIGALAISITSTNDANFTLSIAATAKDSNGNLSTTKTATEAVTVIPLAPTLAPVTATGVEGQKIALNLGVSVNSLPGDTNTLSQLVVSAIPVGAVLSDGPHSFTATATNSSVNIASWTLANLTIKPVGDANFTVNVLATVKDAQGNLNSTSAIEAVIVNPAAPVLAPVAVSGVEGQAISLNLGVTIPNAAGDANALTSLVVSSIPAGATLSDGTHSFTASAGSTSVDIAGWSLSNLKIVTVNDANITLQLSATARDTEGNLSATTNAAETVTVNPLAATITTSATSGVEGQPIAVNLGVSLNQLAGDQNSLASLIVGAIPVGATLSDGTHSFTATSGHTSVDVSSWTLGSLTVKSTNDLNFTLNVTATARDAEGNTGPVASATESVTVRPLAPTLAPVTASGIENAAVALNLGAGVKSLTGDHNSLASLVVSSIPVGATLTDGTRTFTATAGNTSVDISTWKLTTLKISATNDVNFTLGLAATTIDSEGNVSSVTSASEQVVIRPVAPAVTWAAAPAAGIEGSPISLGAIAYSLNGNAGDNNSLASLVVSAIPLGATLSDGTHSFIATPGNSSVDVASWSLASLTITPANDVNFTLSVAATTRDADGDLSTAAVATEKGTVNPLAPALNWAAPQGTYTPGSAFHLGAITYGLNAFAGDNNRLVSLVVHGIPVGATLSDGTNSFTATAGHTTIDVSTWALSNLSLLSSTSNTFTLSVTSTVRDSDGNLSATATAYEATQITTSGTVTSSNGTLDVAGSNITVTVAGSNNSINVATPSDTLVLQGSGNSVNFTANGKLTLTANDSALQITGTNATVALTGSNNSVTFSSSGGSLDLTDPNDTINITGSSNVVTLQASSDTINVGGASNIVTVTGSNNAVNVAGTGDQVTLTGSNDTVSLSGPSTVSLVNASISGATTGIVGQTGVPGSSGDTVSVQLDAASAINVTGANNAAISLTTSGATIEIGSHGAIASAGADAIDATVATGTGSVNLVATVSVTGGVNGINAASGGSGNVVVNASGPVSALAGDGVIAAQNATGTGNVQVSTTGSVTGTGTGSVGLLAEILNSADAGDVSVTALGGVSGTQNALTALTNGSGNVAVEAGGAITSAVRFGIRAQSSGTGDVSVVTDIGTTINSGGAGISAINLDDTIDPSANSVVSVTNNATITSGPTNNPSGSVPQGIAAGFYGSDGSAKTTINGTVIVNNNGNINAAAGYGIDAYNWGNGNVTLNEGANTSVSGALYGLAAYALSKGSGSVAISVGANAAIAGGSLFGIQAFVSGAGSINVTTGDGDTIQSGSIAVNAQSQATANPAGNDIVVTLGNDTIHSGTLNTPSGSATSGAVSVGFSPGGLNQPSATVFGNVTVVSNAQITADKGAGINAYDWGKGDVSVTTGVTSSITAAAGNGIQANALNGGNVSLTNDGVINSGANGLSATASNGNGNVSVVNAGSLSGKTGIFAKSVGSGNVTVENDGQIAATSFSGINVVQNNPGATGGTTITNTGTVTGSASNSAIAVNENNVGSVTLNNSGTIGSGATGFALYESGGDITLNNTGTILGNINTGNGTFNNKAGGIWSVGTWSGLGTASTTGVAESNTINNAGTINLSAGAVITGANGLVVTNTGVIDNLSGYDMITGAVTNTGTIEVIGGTLNLSGGLSGTGTVKIDNGGTLELAGASAQAITFAGGSDTLQLDNALGFSGTIAATATGGGTFAITGLGNVITTSGDAVDLTASGGSAGTPATLIETLSGNLTGAASGVVTIQNGTGDVTVSTSGIVNGGAGNGILAEISATGSGNINLTTTGFVSGAGAGSVGVLAENLDAANNGNVSVVATGGASGTQNAISALTKGNGNVSVEAGGAITATVQYGVRAENDGTGSVSVVTDPGTIINSGGEGISAFNKNTSVPIGANSSVTVTAYGTINFGPTLNPSGSAAKGIDAGYFAGNGTAHTGVNGTVFVDNFANITQTSGTQGYGISAYSYGNGDITLNDEAGTSVSAAQIGIGAFALSGGSQFSGGTANVVVNVADNATITGGSSFGIQAYNTAVGNVSVTTGNGDVISGGSDGIAAIDAASSISGGHTITVNAGADTIHSTTRYGINAGYTPGGAGAISGSVHGDVSVTSNATITSALNGINAFNWGTGNITVVTGPSSSIVSSSSNGIAANAFDGGNVSVTNGGVATGTSGLFAKAVGAANITIENDGTLTATSFSGISVNQNASNAVGSTTISNTGTVTGSGSSAAIFVAENAFGTVTIDNSGTIGPGVIDSSTSAIGVNGASQVTINNSGEINGHVVTGANGAIGANTTFNNTAGAVWQTSFFNDDGTLVASGSTITVIQPGNGAVIGYAGNGTMTLEAGATLTADFLNIGQLIGSSGTVLVTGSGTTVTTTAGQYQNILVGNDGSASLTISDQAVVTTTGMEVGGNYQPGVTDTLLIDNATLNVGQVLTLGNAGAANVTVENAGAIHAGFLGLAQQPGSGANLTVSGTGSQVTASFMQLGTSANVNVLSGGSVSIGGLDDEGAIQLIGGMLDVEGVVGGTGSITLSNGATLVLAGPTSPAPISVTSNSSTLTLSAGNDSVVIAGDGDTVNSSGAGDVLQLSGHNDVVLLSGSSQTVTVSGGNASNVAATLAADGATLNYTETGGGGTINIVGANDTATLNTFNDVINILGANDIVTELSAGNTINVVGDGDIVTLGSSETVLISGAGDQVTLDQGDTAIVTGSSATVTLGGDGVTLTLSGVGTTVAGGDGNNTIIVTDNATSNLSLGGDSVNVTGTNATLAITGGANVNFSASNATLSLGANGDTITVSGSNDVLNLTGASNVIDVAGGNDTVVLSGGSNTVAAAASITGSANGLAVIQNGAGGVVVNASQQVTGQAGNGILAEVSGTGTGNILVSASGLVTGTGAGSVGLLAEILNSADNGDINVTALGGAAGGAFGVDLLTQGNGNLNLEAAGAISAGTNYGIRVRSFGTGSENVTTDAGAVVTSGSTGLTIVNVDTAIPQAANSTITLTNNATIHSGVLSNVDGSVAGGIYIGYRGISPPGIAVPDTDVNGTVIVNNNGNINASAGYGIDAYNWGNGNVTLNEGANTSVSGALYGLAAYALSKGSGSVAVSVGANAAISGGSLFGIQAFVSGAGGINVTTGDGDTIQGGSIAVNAQSQATANPAGNDIVVTLGNDTIHSGTLNTPSGSATSGAVSVGFSPGGLNQPSATVFGNVTVVSNAQITADKGAGINAYDWGKGDVSVTTGVTSSITAAAGNGIQANALNGGNVSLTNDGVINSGANGLSATASNGNGNVSVVNAGSLSGKTGIFAKSVGSGNVTVENDGQIAATSFSGINVVQNNPGATGGTTITNTGTVTGSASNSAIAVNENNVGSVTLNNSGTIGSGATGFALYESGGDITLNNTGTILGNINTGNGTFNNKAGGIWSVGTWSGLGTASTTGVAESNTINNAGTINLSAGAVITGANGLVVTNTGVIDNLSGYDTITGAVTNTGTIEVIGGTLNLSGGLSGTGTVKIDNGGTLELAGASAQAITFAGGSDTLQLDNALGFSGTIAATATGGGTFAITGLGNVITTSGDAVDLTASGGSAGTPATLIETLSGNLTGAASGVVTIQNGTGDVTVSTSGIVNGGAGNGILAEISATGSGNINLTTTGFV